MSKNEVVTTIRFDECGFDPRKDWDNFGTMVCLHRRYSLGDVQNIAIEDACTIENDKNNICLPIYMYDHSGITLSTTPFSCPWDSGKLGFIYVSKEKVRKEYNTSRITKILRQKVLEILKSEVETYDHYVRGEVYGVILSKDGEEIESTWGIIGYENAQELANEMLSAV